MMATPVPTRVTAKPHGPEVLAPKLKFTRGALPGRPPLTPSTVLIKLGATSTLEPLPMPKPSTPPPGDFPKLATPAHRALANAGYTRLTQLAQVTASQLLQLHGLGPSAIPVLRAALAAKGLDFKPEP